MNGWLLIDKNEEISSYGALNIIKQIFRKQGIRNIKIGHAGTLDPFASGLLVVAIGETTKLIDYAMHSVKEYEFTITWGENRDTLDREGVVINKSDNIPTLAQINQMLPSFIGIINQIPPQHSAISINGKRAYSLARAGVEFELKPRPVELIYAKVVNHDHNSTKFEVVCSKGFYIRALARDLSLKLNACGYVSQLRRTKVKKFDVVNAISLDILRNLMHNVESIDSLQFLQDNLLPQLSALDDILVRSVGDFEAQKLRNGQHIQDDCNADSDEVIAVHNSIVLAICVRMNGLLKPRRVLNNI